LSGVESSRQFKCKYTDHLTFQQWIF